jgi:hypothetical protein
LIKKDKSAIQKTEFLLNNYNNLLQALEDKKELLEEVKKYGVRHESASFIEYHQGTNADYTTEFEKKDFLISRLQNQIKEAEHNLFLIERVIDRFRNREPYFFEIIERKYFNKEQTQDIIEDLGINKKTYYRNKKRIIEELAASLFINDYIKELFTGIPE